MVCADCRKSDKQGASYCSCCGRPADVRMTATGGLPFGGRLRWIGSAALLATSIWTGMAGGFGLYSRQVGMARAMTAVAAAFTAVEAGKALQPKPVAHHRAHAPEPAPSPAHESRKN